MLLNVTDANKNDSVPGGFSETFLLSPDVRAIASWGTFGGASAKLQYSFGATKWFDITGHAAQTADDIDVVSLPRAKFRWAVSGITGTTDIYLSVSE